MEKLSEEKEMNDAFHKEAAKFALAKMFEGKRFDVCTINSIEKLGLCKLSSKDSAALDLLHCKDWADMPPDLRKMTFAKVMEGIENAGESSFNLELISSALDGQRTGVLKCLQLK